jgi:predicted RNA-binding Zn-ribbon protein involved in translation (DUF1610 family)
VTESDDKRPPHGFTLTCPHCGHNQLVQIRASEVVAIYQCPSCGELVAPVKPRRESLRPDS